MLYYKGKAFRKRHNISMNALARGLNVPRVRIIELEKNRRECVNRALVGRIVRYFQDQGIACTMDDLLYVGEAPPSDSDQGRGIE